MVMRAANLKPFVVGIDPGKNTGCAVWQRKGDKVLAWCDKTFVTVQSYLDAVFPDKSEVKIFIELPPTFMYRRNDNDNDPQYVRDRKNQLIEGNRTEAKLLFETLLDKGWDVELVAPVREKKWDARRFKLFTGSARSASQHCRDAVRLAIYYANKR